MQKLIKISYRYNHPVKKYLKSKRYFVCTGYALVTRKRLKEIIKMYE
jgi:hypothetical protein